jgi:hypothetical protein
MIYDCIINLEENERDVILSRLPSVPSWPSYETAHLGHKFEGLTQANSLIRAEFRPLYYPNYKPGVLFGELRDYLELHLANYEALLAQIGNIVKVLQNTIPEPPGIDILPLLNRRHTQQDWSRNIRSHVDSDGSGTC